MSTLSSDESVQGAMQTSRLQAAMAGLLPARQVQQVIGLWQACRARGAHCSVREFVGRIAEDFALTEKAANRLRVVLFGDLPTRQPSAAPLPAAAPVKDRVEPEACVFESLVQALDDQLDKGWSRERSRVRAELYRHCREANVQLPQAGRFLRGDIAPAGVAAGMPGDTRQPFVHAYYLTLCEVLGPVAADRLLSQAVAVAEASPGAMQHPPRQWL